MSFPRIILLMLRALPRCGFREAKSKACGKARSGFPPAGQGVWTQRAPEAFPVGRVREGGAGALWRIPQALHGKSITPCRPSAGLGLATETLQGSGQNDSGVSNHTTGTAHKIPVDSAEAANGMGFEVFGPIDKVNKTNCVTEINTVSFCYGGNPNHRAGAQKEE